MAFTSSANKAFVDRMQEHGGKMFDEPGNMFVKPCNRFIARTAGVVPIELPGILRESLARSYKSASQGACRRLLPYFGFSRFLYCGQIGKVFE
jgi:hypothetical protein